MSDLMKNIELKITFSQNKDTCDLESDDYHFLEIFTEQPPGSSPYFVFKTKRWAVNNINELKDLLDQFEKTFNKIKNDYKN